MSIEMPDVLERRADPNIFVAVVRNMLDTARKYNTKGGFIKTFLKMQTTKPVKTVPAYVQSTKQT
jgi:hypothetical protein